MWEEMHRASEHARETSCIVKSHKESVLENWMISQGVRQWTQANLLSWPTEQSGTKPREERSFKTCSLQNRLWFERCCWLKEGLRGEENGIWRGGWEKVLNTDQAMLRSLGFILKQWKSCEDLGRRLSQWRTCYAHMRPWVHALEPTLQSQMWWHLQSHEAETDRSLRLGIQPSWPNWKAPR